MKIIDVFIWYFTSLYFNADVSLASWFTYTKYLDDLLKKLITYLPFGACMLKVLCVFKARKNIIIFTTTIFFYMSWVRFLRSTTQEQQIRLKLTHVCTTTFLLLTSSRVLSATNTGWYQNKESIKGDFIVQKSSFISHKFAAVSKLHVKKVLFWWFLFLSANEKIHIVTRSVVIWI